MAVGRTEQEVVAKCVELQRYWGPRDGKMRSWYRLIQMVDELKTAKMESFVGNDPRSMYNLVLHMLDTEIPHRIEEFDLGNLDLANAVSDVSRFFDIAWQDVSDSFRRTNPRQSLKRAYIGFLLATGWYCVIAMVADDGSRCVADVWNPIEAYPMWDGDMGLSEVAHIFPATGRYGQHLARRTGHQMTNPSARMTVYDYWWTEIDDMFPFALSVWNAIVIDTKLVKYERTRFKRIPIYIGPVGGLPDMGGLSQGSQLSTTSYNAGSYSVSERWKEEIGQSVIATNEHIYRTWNKWWSFSLQLLRDTAQPRIFERSRSGKSIVKPEDVFRRGAIFRGGVDDSVDFLGAPPIPLELRSTQLDLEAMMQRGGVSWALYGNVSGQLTAYVMSQIAASANQVMRPFHEAIQNLNADIDNDWLEDIRLRGVKPYGWKYPAGLDEDLKVSANYEIEIPGDLVQRATVARMLDPEFRLSYSYTIQKLFPEIKSPIQERAQVRADLAELHPTNALIALIQYYRMQAAYLEKIGDSESARLYDLAADATMAELQASATPPQQPQLPPGQGQPPGMGRPEAVPRMTIPQT
ncbi:hypothetical protein LCGC14_2236620 [marine sediment metagenome]|uniref:Uncharacterized protein n=1 Tax=marine sediment metagenome TaxID=412755 RepID=A0A0F9DU90_9ZZZZ